MAPDSSANSGRPVLSPVFSSLNSQDIFSSILDTLEEPFFLLDDAFRFSWHNKACNDLYHAVSGKDIGNDFDFNILLTDEQQSLFRQHLDKAAAGENVHFEWKYQMTFIKWLSVSLYPFRPSNRTFSGICGSLRDITGKKIAERMLLRNTAVLNNISEGVILQTLDKQILTVNKSALAILDLGADKLKEKGFPSPDLILVDEHENEISHEDLFYKRNGQIHGVRNKVFGIRRISGIQWLKLNSAVVANARQKDPYTIVISFEDITRQKKISGEIEILSQNEIEQQKRITRVILETQELERNLLGRELHDNINQILAAIRMQLSYCIENFDICQPVLIQSRENIIEAIEETRRLSHRMVMPRFSERSLPHELKKLVENYQHTQVIHLHTAGWTDEQIAIPVKEAFFRIIQEQMSNIYKHANATEVTIRITSDTGNATLSVEDNGKGFDPGKKKGGIGLSNIHSRAESCNGTAQFISTPGQGCTLLVNIPLFTPPSASTI